MMSAAHLEKIEIRRQNMWRAIRINRKVSARQLASLAEGRGVTITERMAADYLTSLVRARIMRKRGASPVIYSLAVDLGPKPPIFRRVAEVYNPNDATVFWRAPEAKQ